MGANPRGQESETWHPGRQGQGVSARKSDRPSSRSCPLQAWPPPTPGQERFHHILCPRGHRLWGPRWAGEGGNEWSQHLHTLHKRRRPRGPGNRVGSICHSMSAAGSQRGARQPCGPDKSTFKEEGKTLDFLVKHSSFLQLCGLSRVSWRTTLCNLPSIFHISYLDTKDSSS